MAISSFEAQEEEEVPLSMGKKTNISAPGPQIKKIWILCFIKLQKLKKRKCPWIFILWHGSRDIGIISFEA